MGETESGPCGRARSISRVNPTGWARATGLWLIAGSLVVGVLLGFLLLAKVGPWLASAPNAGH